MAGWVEEWNAYGLRVGRRWVAWAIGAAPRPYVGDFAEVETDGDGYAVAVEVRAWRPAPLSTN